MPRMLGEDMDKPADGRGSTGSTDGTKAKAMSGKLDAGFIVIRRNPAIRIRPHPNAGGYRGPIQLVRPNLPSWITVRLCLPLFSPRVTDSSDNGPRGYSLLSCDKQSWKKIVGIMVPSYCLTILGELLNELWFNRKDIIYNGFTECLQAVISSPTAPLVYYGLHGWPTIVYRLGWRSASLGKRNTNLY